MAALHDEGFSLRLLNLKCRFNMLHAMRLVEMLSTAVSDIIEIWPFAIGRLPDKLLRVQLVLTSLIQLIRCREYFFHHAFHQGSIYNILNSFCRRLDQISTNLRQNTIWNKIILKITRKNHFITLKYRITHLAQLQSDVITLRTPCQFQRCFKVIRILINLVKEMLLQEAFCSH